MLSRYQNPKPALTNPKPPLEDNIVISTASTATAPVMMAANQVVLSSALVCAPVNVITADTTKLKKPVCPSHENH